MHNKSYTVDNEISILGGRNIGTEYFDANPDVGFVDLDVMAIGQVVKKVSSAFDLYWNNELAYPASVLFKGEPLTERQVEELRMELKQFVADQEDSEYLLASRNSDLANQFRMDQVEFGWGCAEVVYDQPEKILRDVSEKQYHLSPMLRPHWKGIERELVLFSPYFVPGEQGTVFLTHLARRGVRVHAG